MKNGRNSQDKDIDTRMARLGIREEDIEERFVQSSGKGGQNVNKLATCVWLVHRPTGMSVKCSAERSQYLNRQKARRLLVDKIVSRQQEAERKARAAVEKLRRKNRKKSRKAKEIMLENKRYHSRKKSDRRKIGMLEY